MLTLEQTDSSLTLFKGLRKFLKVQRVDKNRFYVIDFLAKENTGYVSGKIATKVLNGHGLSLGEDELKVMLK